MLKSKSKGVETVFQAMSCSFPIFSVFNIEYKNIGDSHYSI